jgi:hypothetical protein
MSFKTHSVVIKLEVACTKNQKQLHIQLVTTQSHIEDCLKKALGDDFLVRVESASVLEAAK